jgi:hypothetical protein
VRQARGLGQVVVVELERRRHRGVEHLELVAQDLDLAAEAGWRWSVPAGRARTLPVIFRQNSLRTPSAMA